MLKSFKCACNNQSVKDENLILLKNSSGLEEIDFSYCENITDDVIKALVDSGCKLKVINLTCI